MQTLKPRRGAVVLHHARREVNNPQQRGDWPLRPSKSDRSHLTWPIAPGGRKDGGQDTQTGAGVTEPFFIALLMHRDRDRRRAASFNAPLLPYSRVPNISVGGNKHVGRKMLQKIINM